MPLSQEWGREKEGGKRGTGERGIWGGWREQNRVLFLLFANLLGHRANPDSWVIQEGRALCSAVGDAGGRGTTPVLNPHPPGKCGRGA